MCSILIVLVLLVVSGMNECQPLVGETPRCDLVWRVSALKRSSVICIPTNCHRQEYAFLQ